MKNMKKLASLLLALVMVLSLATTAFAAGNGSITISNAIAGQTYNVYKMFHLESQSGNAYSYTVEEAWKNFTTGTGASYVTVENGYVQLKENIDMAAFAKAAKKYAQDNSIAATKSASATADGTVTITGLDLGYYVIDSTLGTVCALTNTNSTFTAVEKNKKPTSNKQVQEDSNNQWGATNDADFNQTVNYKSEVKVEAGAINYKFIDEMSDGLDLDANSIKVTVDGSEITAGATTYTTTTDTDKHGFTIAFNNDWIASQVGKTIVITYSATLNQNAVVAGTGNTNTAKLEYGNKTGDTHDTTPPTTTTTYTWEFNIFKHDKDKKALQGAEFKLYKMEGTAKKYAIIASGKLTGWADSEANGTTLVTDANGKIEIDGLDADTYYLTETKAPAGYNKLSSDVTVIIDNDGNVKDSANGSALADKTVNIQNNAGSELPSTGGIGTTIFYTLGGILMLAAVVLLVTKKRMTAAE